MQRNLTPLNVVAAALMGADGKVLIQRRPEGAMHGGLWEFPGGKVEPGESRESALVRELQEELGIRVDARAIRHVARAPEQGAPGAEDAAVVIDLYIVAAWAGEPQCLPGARIDWFAPVMLAGLAMPPLDYPLAEGLVRAIAGK